MILWLTGRGTGSSFLPPPADVSSGNALNLKCSVFGYVHVCEYIWMNEAVVNILKKVPSMRGFWVPTFMRSVLIWFRGLTRLQNTFHFYRETEGEVFIENYE
ncbi:hypothetical protein AMECASPLE_033861 [Ameca splendens]|uniref:Ig-like domain-containing protein n=1 Tax=Ameca splendens TaxID=208324 RepID=A0ABV1A2C2_9TELE